jgi:hypothetical protein
MQNRQTGKLSDKFGVLAGRGGDAQRLGVFFKPELGVFFKPELGVLANRNFGCVYTSKRLPTRGISYSEMATANSIRSIGHENGAKYANQSRAMKPREK